MLNFLVGSFDTGKIGCLVSQQASDSSSRVWVAGVLCDVVEHAAQFVLTLASTVVSVAVTDVVCQQTFGSRDKLINFHGGCVSDDSDLQSKCLEPDSWANTFTSKQGFKGGQLFRQRNLFSLGSAFQSAVHSLAAGVEQGL